MNKVETVIRILLRICPFACIEPETELIESGILTSVELFELLMELETELDIRIPEELIEPENFATAETIARTVLKGV